MAVVVGAHTMAWPMVGSRVLGGALGPLGWLLQACCKLVAAWANLPPWCLGALGPPLVGATSPFLGPQALGATGQPHTSTTTAIAAPHKWAHPTMKPPRLLQNSMNLHQILCKFMGGQVWGGLVHQGPPQSPPTAMCSPPNAATPPHTSMGARHLVPTSLGHGQ